MICACGHDQADHQPDCCAVLRPDVFCECSGFRTEHTDVDPRFRPGHLGAIQRERMPSWMTLAECSKHAMDGAWSEAFREDPAYQANPDNYRWPATVQEVMAVCASCPVRRECLAYAYEITGPQLFGDVNLYASHTTECNEGHRAWQSKARLCEGCLEPEDQVHRQPFEIEQQHEGVYGGVPGPVRQHFQHSPELADKWFAAWTAKRGWTVADMEEETA